jgi:hypothetical protein
MLQSSQHYELLNYSEHGTTVDNVMYSCDLTEWPSQPISQDSTTPTCNPREPSLADSVKLVLDTRRKK